MADTEGPGITCRHVTDAHYENLIGIKDASRTTISDDADLQLARKFELGIGFSFLAIQRFPVISGFRVSWDSRRPAGQRVLGVWLQKEISGSARSSQVNIDDEEEITRKEGGRKYKIVTQRYIAQGRDGFLPLKGAPYLIDDESGLIISGLLRRYTLGSLYVNKMARLGTRVSVDHLHPETRTIISQAHTTSTRAVKHWHHAAMLAVRHSRSKAHYKDRIDVSGREDMSDVDCFHGAQARKGIIGVGGHGDGADEDLLLIHPVVDGRLKDEGRQ
ncbi:hypothetical protein FIBSPDRAFT_941342 [Athelia psychrophila]|uniref:5'-Nucleotidase C-terminal domain-containing protein n=1 Tax=Athelia psychrophila TaxID=1759441 RepID=A0A167UBT7_9AGAM|nr:hypothetical protein FIBSPDRAFT_941342 [Fibularhizoctonia sp. CBS 109695]